MNEIKVLYIGGFELPDKNAAAHRVINISKAVRELGGEVVFAGISKELDWNKNVLDTRMNCNGFTTYALPYPRKKTQWVAYLTSIKPYLNILEAEKDISAVFYYNTPAAVMKKMMAICKKRKIKNVADVTEWYSAKGQGLVFFILKGADTWFRMNVFHKQMDGLIVISRYLKEYYHTQKCIVYLPPLVDKKEEKWSSLPSKKDDDILHLVYAGSPVIKDRIDVLISALREVKRPYTLDIVGITKEEYLNKVPDDRSFIESTPYIVFHGRVSHKEALYYVGYADYSCFFRDDDRMTRAGFSTKFVEAISSGTPAFTNNTSNILDYCENGENAVVLQSISVDSIRQAIDDMKKRIPTNSDQFDYSKYRNEIKLFLSDL